MLRSLVLFSLCLTPGLVGCGIQDSDSGHAIAPITVTERSDATGPRILIVVAHPDDEIAFAGTIYKTTTHLDGVVDLLTITNGEGGFKYATLAEERYGLQLTDEAIGRRHLPEIRQQELINGCGDLRVHTITFLRQRDHRYTQNPGEVLDETAGVWDLGVVRAQLDLRLAEGAYDFVVGIGPSTGTHGHHQAATILAAEAVARVNMATRPTMLAVRHRRSEGEAPVLETNPYAPELTRVVEHPTLVFDLAQKFGHKQKLDYSIVANWAISAHKSQGTMQLLVGPAGEEHYFVLAPSPPEGPERAQRLFERLAEPQFTTPVYGDSAGTNAR